MSKMDYFGGPNMTLATWLDKTKNSVANEIFSHFLKGELAKYVEREREEEE